MDSSRLTLPHGDPLAVELVTAVHSGDLDTLKRLLDDQPALATAHMIGRKGREGRWRTPLHAATDTERENVISWLRERGAAPAC